MDCTEDTLWASVAQIYAAVKAEVHGGSTASYIPMLAKVDKELFSVSICTTDGRKFSVGDTDAHFSMQSCATPLSYAVAVEDLGLAAVHRYVGFSPSGSAFNEVSLDTDKRPWNPYLNAGAIAVASLLGPGLDSASKFRYFRDHVVSMAGGGRVGFSQATYLCEQETAWRNKALVAYMTAEKAFPEGSDTTPDEALDFYLQCCSLEINTSVGASIAATLANGGVSPLTHQQVLSGETVKATTSLMLSCGMYDYSGRWMSEVQLPSKSGVSGLILISVPGVMGVAVYAPCLDKHGNSVRGVEFCSRFSRAHSLGVFDRLVSRAGANGIVTGGIFRISTARAPAAVSVAMAGRWRVLFSNLRRFHHAVRLMRCLAGLPCQASAAKALLEAALTQRGDAGAAEVVALLQADGFGTESSCSGGFPDLSARVAMGSCASRSVWGWRTLPALHDLYRALLTLQQLNALTARSPVITSPLASPVKPIELAELQKCFAVHSAVVPTQAITQLLHYRHYALDKHAPLLHAEVEALRVAHPRTVSMRDVLLSGRFPALARVLCKRSILSTLPNFEATVRSAFTSVCNDAFGSVYTELPIEELTSVDPDRFAVCITTVDGQVLHFGDSEYEFPVMGTVRTLLHALACQDAGLSDVAEWCGEEPTTADPTGFSLMHGEGHPRPWNPYLESGALVMCSLVGKAHQPASQRLFHDNGTRFSHMIANFSKWSGNRKINFNNSVFLCQKEKRLKTAAVSYYLKGMRSFPPNSNPTDLSHMLYQAEATEFSASALSAVAAMLANAGVSPLSNEACLEPQVVRSVLSLMYNSGLGTFSGRAMFTSGLPATSGVSGGYMVVVPQVMGIAFYAPRLTADTLVPPRAVRMCELLSTAFGFNVLDSLSRCTQTGLVIPASAAVGATAGMDVGVIGKGSDKGSGSTWVGSSSLAGLHSRVTELIDARRSKLGFELSSAASAGDVKRLREILRSGVDVNAGDYDSRTALHVACADGQVEACRVLLAAGASALIPDRWGRTAVEEARECGVPDMAALMEHVRFSSAGTVARSHDIVVVGGGGGVGGGLTIRARRSSFTASQGDMHGGVGVHMGNVTPVFGPTHHTVLRTCLSALDGGSESPALMSTVPQAVSQAIHGASSSVLPAPTPMCSPRLAAMRSSISRASVGHMSPNMTPLAATNGNVGGVGRTTGATSSPLVPLPALTTPDASVGLSLDLLTLSS